MPIFDEIFDKNVGMKFQIDRWKSKRNKPFVLHPHSSGFRQFSALSLGKEKSEIIDDWKNLDEKKRKRLDKLLRVCPDPVHSRLIPQRNIGCLPETLLDSMKKIVDDEDYDFKQVLYLKALHSMVEPGEAVGMLAAQVFQGSKGVSGPKI